MMISEAVSLLKAKDHRQTLRWIVLGFMLILFVISLLFGLMVGSIEIRPTAIVQALLKQGGELERQIIWDLRLPRVLTGMMVGMCLAVSGALLQGVMRNPLADPGIIGVSSGGGLMAITMLIVFPHLNQFVPLAAFLGALIAAAAIYGLAWNNGITPLRIVLAGVAVNSVLGGITSAIMIIYSDRVQAVLPWLVGGLSGRSWPHVQIIAPYTAVGIIVSIFAVKPANTLLLGDDAAKLLGSNVERSRLFLITLSTFLAGIAVSVAGLIGFVGLVVPHIVRLLVGNQYAFLLPLSAIGGGLLVVAADTAARSWFDPIELPVGILLAVLGGPFFLYLLRKGGIIHEKRARN